MSKENVTGIAGGENDSRSAERLNEYIRIGSPGGIILIIALAVVAAAVIIWGFVGSIPVTVTKACVITGDDTGVKTALCFLDVDTYQGDIPAGNKATVRMDDGKVFSGTVGYTVSNPLTDKEIRERFSDYFDTFDENASAATESSGMATDGIPFIEWIFDKIMEPDHEFYKTVIIRTDEDMSEYFHQTGNVSIVLREVKPFSFLAGK